MTFRTTALGAASAALLLMTATAQASGESANTKVADAGPQVHAVTADRDEEVSCSRTRRRLWIEGEGWVVRRITTCR